MNKLSLIAIFGVLGIFLLVMFVGLGMGNFQNLFGAFIGMMIFAIIVIVFFFVLVLKVLAKK